MAEQIKVIAAGGAPARDNDGLHRRRGIWHATIRVGGKLRELSLHTRVYTEARRARARLIEAEAQGSLPSDMARWPLDRAIQTWLDSRAHDTAPSSQRRYRELARALARHFTARTLGDVTSEMIRAYQAQRLAVLSPRSVNLEMRVIRMVLRRAKLWARIADDYQPVREPAQGPGRALAPDQEAALFRVAASRPEWHVAYCCALLAANTTARRCEITGLRIADVDLLERVIRIRRATTKTDAGCRIVPLNDAAAWALARLLERAKALGSSQPDHYLLPLARHRQTKAATPCGGAAFDPASHQKDWRSAWRSLTAAAGLAGLRFHDLRHHAITKLAESGAPDHVIMSLAGHVSRAMLEHYSHVRTEAKRAAIAAISTGVPGQDAQPAADRTEAARVQ